VKFGPVPVAESEGGVVAHTVRLNGLILKKGEIVRAEHVSALQTAGLAEITIARLESGDVGEDAAAVQLAEKVAGADVRIEKPFTGRSNLFSKAAGVLTIDLTALDRVNDVDEAITVATLPAFRTVVEGEMIGTVKIIPFAVPGEILARAMAAARESVVEVRRFSPLSVGVVSTILPGMKPSIVDKTLRALEKRLAPARAKIVVETRAPHDAAALAAALREMAPRCDLLIVFGASAITDRRDVIPAAVEAAGGRIERLGMPVDPGNLLLLARTAENRPLLGAPGCARSPKENGFDWVLHRLLANVPVGPADIRAMGAGGLLMEIVSRPQLRSGSQADVETYAERLEADEDD
jgi:molybdenum cofactor cytidylyltransferase